MNSKSMNIDRMFLPTRRSGLLCTLVVALAAILLKGNSYANHPFHVCVGQMRWSPESSKWEVSLRMHPRDLELAIADANRKNISREDQDFSSHAIEFLENQFFLLSSPDTQDLKVLQKRISDLPPTKSLQQQDSTIGRRSRLEWVGMESERGWLWIHLEMTPPQSDGEKEPLYLVHRIFMDRIEAQENSVAILQTQTDRRSLQFKKGQSVKLFRADPPKP